jgi:uncharacterized protein (TIGR02117 family)
VIRRTGRWLARGIGFFLTVLGLYLAVSVGGGLWGNGHPSRDGNIRVGLIIGGIHTDLLIPLTPDVRARFAFAQMGGVPVLDEGAEWLLVGWGAREFYTTAGTYADITASAVFSGVTGDTAVMRLDVLGLISDLSGIPSVTVNDAQFAALLDTVEASLARDASGAPIALDHPGFSPTDGFFAAQGGFNILRTCNVWVGETFAAAGIPFGRWTPTPYAVHLALWRFHAGR